MNSLTGAEKRWLENAFDMGGGTVLDFKNPSFERFFNSYGVDIYGARYQFHGNSKANRLRAFWDIESDELVGRILMGLLDSSGFLERDSVELRKSRMILDKLSGMSIEESHLISLQYRSQEEEMMSDERRLEQLWGPGAIRVFISHTSKFKNDAMAIKDELEVFGIASFVAHHDIDPSEEWQEEIVRALSSMNMFVALLTDGFKESLWTDQEVGFALARKVPVLPVDRGLTPYGFIGRYQALKMLRSDAFPVAKTILEMALKNVELRSIAISAFIEAVAGTRSWAEANRLSRILPSIDFLTPEQADWFVNIYNLNSQVYEEWNFQDRISEELGRMTGNSYVVDDRRRLHQVPQPEDIPF